MLMGQVSTHHALRQQNHQLKLTVGTGLNLGITRQHKPNEDSLFAIQGTQTYEERLQPFGVFMIADGMGGHARGEEASDLALRVLSNSIVPPLLGNAALCQDALQELLMNSTQRANAVLYQHNLHEGANMGTTVTATLVTGATAYVVNVGDSRAYLYHEPGGLRQITRDHSVVARLVEAGAIAPADIYTHPKRNQLVRYLGEKATVEVDAFTFPLETGDNLLLCSDGLWEMVYDTTIERIMSDHTSDPSLVVQLLIRAALDGGGKDNISVVAVSMS
jgi:serine/threonine protein phosphatase PrpC